MLPFNALNERNRKQEIGNEASGFYPLSPGRTKETTRRKTIHWLPGSVERHSLTAFNLQSKKATRQNQKASPYTDFQAPVEGYNLLLPLPNRRTGPRPCQGPIERRDFAVASPNRRRPTECKSKAASPQSKDTHFSYFYLIFPSYFLCTSIWL